MLHNYSHSSLTPRRTHGYPIIVDCEQSITSVVAHVLPHQFHCGNTHLRQPYNENVI